MFTSVQRQNVPIFEVSIICLLSLSSAEITKFEMEWNEAEKICSMTKIVRGIEMPKGKKSVWQKGKGAKIEMPQLECILCNGKKWWQKFTRQ